jgi:hypothetical protein
LLIVAPILDPSAVLPLEDDPFRFQNGEFAGNEPRIAELSFGNLPFAYAGFEVGAPSQGAGWHIIVAGDFSSLKRRAVLDDPDKLVEVAPVVADPLSRQVQRGI